MAEETVNRGIMEVTPEMLEEALHFPVGHHILAVEKDWQIHKGVYALVIAGPSLPIVCKGEHIPIVLAYGEPNKPLQFKRW